MRKKKESFWLHQLDMYRLFFRQQDMEGLEKVLENVQQDKEKLHRFEKVQLKNLIAHARSIENKQKQPQVLGIFASTVLSFAALLFSLLPKNSTNLWYGLIFYALAAMLFVFIPRFSKVIGLYLESIMYVTMFRELAELVLEEKNEQEDTTEEATSSDFIQ